MLFSQQTENSIIFMICFSFFVKEKTYEEYLQRSFQSVITHFQNTEDLVVFQYFSACHTIAIQFDDKCTSGNGTTELFDHLAGSFRRSTGCQQIIYDNNSCPWLDRILMQAYFIGAVFQIILTGNGFSWKFSRLSDRCKSDSHFHS